MKKSCIFRDIKGVVGRGTIGGASEVCILLVTFTVGVRRLLVLARTV